VSVYVNRVFSATPLFTHHKRDRTWRWSSACHLFADSVEELHAMARALNINKRGFHRRVELPHYLLTTSKRAQAIELGAIEMEISAFYRQQREKGREQHGRA